MSAEAVEHNNKVHECGGTRGLVVEELNGLASIYGTWVTGNPLGGDHSFSRSHAPSTTDTCERERPILQSTRAPIGTSCWKPAPR